MSNFLLNYKYSVLLIVPLTLLFLGLRDISHQSQSSLIAQQGRWTYFQQIEDNLQYSNDKRLSKSLQQNDAVSKDNAKYLAKPTKTPRPTKTPLAIPPSQNVSQTNLMILFVALAVVVVLIGVWINRERK